MCCRNVSFSVLYPSRVLRQRTVARNRGWCCCRDVLFFLVTRCAYVRYFVKVDSGVPGTQWNFERALYYSAENGLNRDTPEYELTVLRLFDGLLTIFHNINLYSVDQWHGTVGFNRFDS